MIDKQTDSNEFYCSLVSAAADEPLIGTAPHTLNWILIEYRQSWGNKAWEESDIPEEVKTHIDSELERLEQSKLLLIRGTDSKEYPALRLFIIRVENGIFNQYALEFKDYTDLLDVDLSNAGTRDPEPTILICTNGRRDICCAKFGFPVYQSICESKRVRVFECTHLGQHRLGPNALLFPSGRFHGRITYEYLPGFLDSIEHDKVDLRTLRGRTNLTGPPQAAEILLRELLQIDTESTPNIRSVKQKGNNSWEIGIDFGTRNFKINLSSTISPNPIPAACEGDNLVNPVSFQLVDYEELNGT